MKIEVELSNARETGETKDDLVRVKTEAEAFDAIRLRRPR